jgi:hypothetical protein
MGRRIRDRGLLSQGLYSRGRLEAGLVGLWPTLPLRNTLKSLRMQVIRRHPDDHEVVERPAAAVEHRILPLGSLPSYPAPVPKLK